MNDLLQKAIDSVRISDVYLRASRSHLSDDFDPKFAGDLEDLAVQFKHGVSKWEIIAVGENEEEARLYRVFIDLATRWAYLEEGGDDDPVPDIKAEIEATFVAEYLLEKDPGKEALEEFAFRNASYHVWPYWREYLTSQCMRMNMPKLVLPAVQFAMNSRADRKREQ